MLEISEEWRDIIGHEEKYQVSSEGRIRSLDRYVLTNRWCSGETRLLRGRILKPKALPKTGYLQVNLGRDSHCYVHDLVLTAFVCPRPKGMVARHFPDPTPSNNNKCNLCWGTRLENEKDKVLSGTDPLSRAIRGEYNGSTKLTVEDVREIRRVYIPKHPEFGGKPLARKYNVGPMEISRIVHKQRWEHVE
jgi:hypothetical protein